MEIPFYRCRVPLVFLRRRVAIGYCGIRVFDELPTRDRPTCWNRELRLELAASDCGLLKGRDRGVYAVAGRSSREGERKKENAGLAVSRIDEPCNVRFHRWYCRSINVGRSVGRSVASSVGL